MRRFSVGILLIAASRKHSHTAPMRLSPLARVAVVVLGNVCLVGCGDEAHSAAEQQPAPDLSAEHRSNARATNPTSFKLMAANGPKRLATLQAVVTGLGQRCNLVTSGVLTAGLDGTDEWRVTCADSGEWAVWFSRAGKTEVLHCSRVNCTATSGVKEQLGTDQFESFAAQADADQRQAQSDGKRAMAREQRESAGEAN